MADQETIQLTDQSVVVLKHHGSYQQHNRDLQVPPPLPETSTPFVSCKEVDRRALLGPSIGVARRWSLATEAMQLDVTAPRARLEVALTRAVLARKSAGQTLKKTSSICFQNIRDRSCLLSGTDALAEEFGV